MKKTIYSILSLSVILTIISSLQSCSKENNTESIDTQLFNMAKNTANMVWYKNSSALLPKSSGTGHSESFLKTRYNSIAAAKIGTDGKVMAGISFPEGSLIVKELYTDANTLSKYAILYKQTGNVNADAKGWVWGYLNADGTTVASASSKGSGCISCHSQSGSIDYTLMNKYF